MPDPKKVWATDPQYLKAAFSKLGLSEIAGPRHEKEVLAMYAASGHPEIEEDEVPWCAAFVGWALAKGNLPNTGSLLAISYAKYGTAVSKSDAIPRGAIAVWKRTGGNHVNFVLADDGTNVTCIGGNQENGKGGGVTISVRRKSQALAYRLPINVAAVEEMAEPKVAPVLTPTARTAGLGTAAVALAGQAASVITGPVQQTVETVNQVQTTSGQVIETTKQVAHVVPDGFWVKVLAFLQSPLFLSLALLIVIGAWATTYYLRKRKEVVT